ncbi:HEXXH motif-containing putative peptide modification protein [Polymorphospora rubra]|uniref:aKG-HExxH-type peptide beta-hydroxylase n=1 Tax=Polymorphospora rubra TaxID=338584 RepID=UPI0033FBC026
MPDPTRSLPSTPASDPPAVPALRLTAAQFGGLAAGYGDQAAIGVLHDGQLAKRRLLLRALAAAAGPAGRAALDLLSTADRRAPGAVRTVLGQPHLDAAAAARLRRGTPDDLLCRYAAAAAALAGLRFTIRVPTDAGHLHLPALGTAVGVGPGPATVCGTFTGISVVGSRDTLSVPAPFDAGTRAWWPLRRLTVEASGQRLTLAVDDLDPERDCYQWPPADRLDDAGLARFAALLGDAWQSIVTDHPDHAAAIQGLLWSVVPLSPAAGNVSAASRRAGGSIALAVPADAPGLALLILHEFQHMKLNALLDLVDLCSAAGPPRHRAPWRLDPRPVGALLQGTYAHLAVADFWRRHRHRAAAAGAHLEFAYWLAQSRQGAATLAASGELTGPGDTFVAGLAATLDGWHATEDVPAGVRDAVADLSVAAAVSWHLRNLRPTSATVAGLAAQWAAGTPRPDVPAADWGPAPPPGPAPVSVVEAAIRSRPAEPPGTPSDQDEWLRRLAADPNDIDAWAGLAVALRPVDPTAVRGLTARPELVRALYAHPDAGAGGPRRLAAWIGAGLDR